MSISRRRFIKSGSLAALAAGVVLNPQARAFAQNSTQGTSLGFPIPLSAQQQPDYMFTSGTFLPYVGSIFQAPDALGHMISLTLLNVRVYKPAASTRLSTKAAPDTESFALCFRASGALPPFTSMHRVSHPALGNFDLFLSPHSLPGQERIYEAVFSHI